MTRFAQDADLFEKFKVVVEPICTATVVADFGESHIEVIRKQGHYDLVAIFDYRNPDVKVISNGRNWAMLDDLLPQEVS